MSMDTMNKWQRAIDEEMVMTSQGVANDDDDPKVLLNKIITWHVQVALDPAVSSDAQALYQRGAQDAFNTMSKAFGKAVLPKGTPV